MAYYRVTDTRDGKVYRIENTSKTRVRRELTRFCPVGGYHSFWKIEEVYFWVYRKLEDLPPHLYA